MSADRKLEVIREGQTDAVFKRLDEAGLKVFDGAEIAEYTARLMQAIKIGLERPAGQDPAGDGGLLAFKTGIEPITPEEWSQVPEGAGVIACAFAGTNWVVSYVSKKDGEADVKELYKEKIPIEKRRHTLDSFVELMAKGISGAVSKGVAEGLFRVEDVKAVGIALGFPQLNRKVGYGVDAAFTMAEPAKYWEILDYQEKQWLGERLIEILRDKYDIELAAIYIKNDTNSVADQAKGTMEEKLNLPAKTARRLPRVGLVSGSGDNASLGEVNLEIGKARILPADEIMEKMIAEGLVPTDYPIIEYWMGGDYIKARVAMAMEILAKDGLLACGHELYQLLIRNPDASIISRIANEADGRGLRILRAWGISDPQELLLVQIACLGVLAQAGQLMGIVAGSVLKTAGYTNEREDIPVEGNVFHEGFGVRKKFLEVVNWIMPLHHNLDFVEASGTAGIGQYAMVQEYVKRGVK